MQLAVVSDTLGVPIDDRIWLQATLAAAEGGLVYGRLPIFSCQHSSLAAPKPAALQNKPQPSR